MRAIITICFGLALCLAAIKASISHRASDDVKVILEKINARMYREPTDDYFSACMNNSIDFGEVKNDLKKIVEMQDTDLLKLYLSGFGRQYFHYQPVLLQKSPKHLFDGLISIEENSGWVLRTKSDNYKLDIEKSAQDPFLLIVSASGEVRNIELGNDVAGIVVHNDKRLISVNLDRSTSFWLDTLASDK